MELLADDDPRKSKSMLQRGSPNENNAMRKYSFGVHSAIFDTVETNGNVQIHCDGDATVEIARKNGMLIHAWHQIDRFWTAAIGDLVIVMLPMISELTSTWFWLVFKRLETTPENLRLAHKTLDLESRTLMYIFKVVPKIDMEQSLSNLTLGFRRSSESHNESMKDGRLPDSIPVLSRLSIEINDDSPPGNLENRWNVDESKTLSNADDCREMHETQSKKMRL